MKTRFADLIQSLEVAELQRTAKMRCSGYEGGRRSRNGKNLQQQLGRICGADFPVKNSTAVTITAKAGSSQVHGTLTVGITSQPQSIK